MSTNVSKLWIYLSTTPLLWLAATLSIYWLADRIFLLSRRFPLANPVLLSAIVLGALRKFSDTRYQTYFQGAQFVHFMLGPATVALAVPLVGEVQELRRRALPVALALIVGSLTAIISAVGIAWAMGASTTIQASLAPKSVTTPIAMGISKAVGGIPALTAVLVILTGIIVAVIAQPWFNTLRIRDDAARGFASGLAGHGIGTARAFQAGRRAGTYAGLALALNGVLTAVLVPYLMALWLH
ncbi:MAG: LrgB family protein [Rhizomicrobium sp.]